MAPAPAQNWRNALQLQGTRDGNSENQVFEGVLAAADLKRGCLKPVFNGKCGEQITCHTQNARCKGTGKGEKKARLESEGPYTVSVVAIKEEGLQDADLLSLSMAWPRSRLDLIDLATIREQPEPRQQTSGNEHRLSRGFEELGMKMEDRPNTRSDLDMRQEMGDQKTLALCCSRNFLKIPLPLSGSNRTDLRQDHPAMGIPFRSGAESQSKSGTPTWDPLCPTETYFPRMQRARLPVLQQLKPGGQRTLMLQRP